MVQKKKSKERESKRESMKKGKEALKKKGKENLKKNLEGRGKFKNDLFSPSDVERKELIALQESLEVKKSKNAEHIKERTCYIQWLGYVFSPSEEKLVDYYLRNKILGIKMILCPIQDIDVFPNHPSELSGKSEVLYFTRSLPDEIQPGGTNIKGHWIHCEKEDVFVEGAKVGVKQVFEYCEGDHKCKYKIIIYQLDPVPDNLRDGLWFLSAMAPIIAIESSSPLAVAKEEEKKEELEEESDGEMGFNLFDD